jgi:hypothetical protein
MSLLITLKKAMLTVARNDQGRFLWNRSGSTSWPEPVLCALLSAMIVSDILLKTAGRINDQFPWNPSGTHAIAF